MPEKQLLDTLQTARYRFLVMSERSDSPSAGNNPEITQAEQNAWDALAIKHLERQMDWFGEHKSELFNTMPKRLGWWVVAVWGGRTEDEECQGRLFETSQEAVTFAEKMPDGNRFVDVFIRGMRDPRVYSTQSLHPADAN